MKKLLPLIYMLISLITHGQDNQKARDSMILFAPSEIGKPDGELISLKIGANGGRLLSRDNKVELIIPAGALASETMISIQPYTNPGENGVGKSYSFEPSGTRFQQPVQLVLHYTDEQLDGDSPQLITITTQNEKGVWYRLRKITLDTTAKTITGNITHFSLWSLRYYSVFKPDESRVKVSNTTDVFFWLYPIDGVGEPGDYEDMINDVFGPDFSNPRIWSVNGIVGGDSEVGTIHGRIIRRATYTAPAKVPDQNPVLVVLEIEGGHIGLGTPAQLGNYYKKCEITVYDNLYEVKMIASMTGGDKRNWGGKTTYYDEGSFIVSLDTKTPTILDIKNNLETVTDNCRDRVILNHGSNTGMVHITGASKITATPVESPGGWETLVEITFIPRPVVLSLIKYNCPPPPGHNVPNSTPLNVLGVGMMQSMPAQPVHIRFTAKEGEQIIEEKGTPGGPLYFKISVKQVIEE